MAAAIKKEEAYSWKAGANSGHITNLKQSILETFDIYGLDPLMVQVSQLNPNKVVIVSRVLQRQNGATTLSKMTLGITTLSMMALIEQHALKNVNIYLNTNIYSYIESSGGQISNIYN
jgi:hypothetical protein